MTPALLRTITELLDSKKAAYNFVAVIAAVCLIQFLHWSPEVAMVVVAPLVVGSLSQAHVDAQEAKSKAPAAPSAVGNVIEAPVAITPATFETETPPPRAPS